MDKGNFKKESFVDQEKDECVIDQRIEVANWVNNSKQFRDYAKRDFLEVGVADPWLCAYASVHNLVVVTAEVRDPNIKKRVPLPNVLEAFEVDYVDVFSCLRSLKARFELAQ